MSRDFSERHVRFKEDNWFKMIFGANKSPLSP